MKTIGEMSTDSRILANKLKVELIDGKKDVCTYEELSAAIGRDVRTKNGIGLLRTARKSLQRDQGIVLVAVNSVGISIEKDFGGFLEGHRRHVQTTTRRKLRDVSHAIVTSPDTMSNDQKLQTMTNMSLLGAVVQMTKPSSQKKLEAKVSECGVKELPTAETLRLFGNGK
jgi:hypothetical protein